MAKRKTGVRIKDELIMNRIIIVRGQKVMIDRDLAELYGTSTKKLNQQVSRNKDRFPRDFMFQLTETEKEEVVTNCDHLGNLRYSSQLPFVFTEYGAVMLASVLNSTRAVQVNIQIVRVFIKMREMLMTHKDVLLKIEEIEKRLGKQDDKVQMLFDYLKHFVSEKEKPRKKVGFKISRKKSK